MVSRPPAENVLTAVGDYKFTGTWDLGGRYSYHTGSTYDTVAGSVFNTNLDKYGELVPCTAFICRGIKIGTKKTWSTDFERIA